MNKKISIKICGLHDMEFEDEHEKIEVINIGTYYRRNGKHYFKYDDPDEDTGELNKCIIKVSEAEVEVMVNGPQGNHMIFTRGQKNLTYYNTPFGGTNIGIETYTLDIDEQKDFIRIHIEYGLEINLNFVSKCQVDIEVESLDE